MIPTALYDYIRQPHEVCWTGSRLQSQVWRGLPWFHELIMCRPGQEWQVALGKATSFLPPRGGGADGPPAAEGVGSFGVAYPHPVRKLTDLSLQAGRGSQDVQPPPSGADREAVTDVSLGSQTPGELPRHPDPEGVAADTLSPALSHREREQRELDQNPPPRGGGGEERAGGGVPSNVQPRPLSSQDSDFPLLEEGDFSLSTCVLYVTGGPSNLADINWCLQLADETQVPVVALFNIPNQPIWDRMEDELIAYTLDQCLETGHLDWPLLFPMVQSVVAAMDALQTIGFDRFIVHGASKRGWTAWLAGVLQDERVVGIAPEVFDNLNMGAQMGKQLAYWGTYSPMIEPYVSEDLPQRLSDPKVQELAAMIDPFSYLLNLNQTPTYLIMGTNDPYWTVDSVQLYWDHVDAPKWIDYAPNCPHVIGDRPWAPRGLPGFVRYCAALGPAPTNQGARTTWWAHAPDRHFENATWFTDPPQAKTGYVAWFDRYDHAGTVSCTPMKLKAL